MASGIQKQLRLAALFAALAWATPTTAGAAAPPGTGDVRSVAPEPGGTLRENGVLDEISGSLVVGPGWFDPGDVEDSLREYGFEDVETQAVLLGLSGRMIFDNGIALGAGGAILGHPAVDGTGAYDAALSYSMLRAEGGYALLHSDRWLLLPKLALGAYAAGLTLSDDRDATFDELLEEPGTTTRLSSRGFQMGALLDFEFRMIPGGTDGLHGFFGVGVEGGYLYSFPLTRWRLDTGAEVEGGPDAPLTGGFLGVTLGGGVLDL